jgi:hypothetical protein
MDGFGSWPRSSHLLKSKAKYPSATEQPSDTKGMVLELRERGGLMEVVRHPVTGKAALLFSVTAHKVVLHIAFKHTGG